MKAALGVRFAGAAFFAAGAAVLAGAVLVAGVAFFAVAILNLSIK